VKRTGPASLITLGVVGLAVGYLFELALTGGGRPSLVPPITLSVTLVAIAVIVVLLAIPIRRAVHSTVRVRVDPFRAMRVAVLAKACGLTGALLTGLGVGILVFELSRPAQQAGSVWQSAVAALSAIILLVGGLIAEWFCTLPPPEDPDAEVHGDHAPAR
jgi:hypothetical protein